ncbi:MAG: CBS domain-containing protein [Saprospiraceae bacterium]|nr:CBS domain-containing protein [Saprospiraceae bacterium]
MKIQEVMQTNPRCIFASEKLSKIRQIFQEESFHHLPVLDEEGEVVGIISQDDFKYALEKIASTRSESSFAQEVLDTWTAERIMTHNPTFLRPSDPIQRAANYFLENRFHALPVMDEDHNIVGIITSHDLLKLAYH